MKNIKRYNEFQTNEEVKLKDVVAGAALTATTLFPSKAIAGTEPGDTLHKVVKSKSDMEKLVKYNHWTLDSTHIDTLYEIIKVRDPKKDIFVDTLDFDIDEGLFTTGNSTLNGNIFGSILDAINEISGKNGTITDFQIESSTDTEPIKMGNDVLAQKRADVVKDKLVEIGVDPSIISIETLPEQGPRLYGKLTKSQRDEARLQTKEFRYVRVRIIYIITTDLDLPGEFDTIIKNKKTYYLSKPFSGGGQKPPRLKSHFGKTTISVPALEVNRDNGRTKCARWGKKRLRYKKQFWNNKKIGYE